MKYARVLLLLFIVGIMLAYGHLLSVVWRKEDKNLVPNSRSGIWQKYYYVDEFDLPTDKWHVRNAEPIIGKFSNREADDALLCAYLFIEGGLIAIRLIEHGEDIVKNASAKPIVYETALLDSNGKKVSFSGRMDSGQDVIDYDEASSGCILAALRMHGTTHFSLRAGNDPTARYLFAIKGASGMEPFIPPEMSKPPKASALGGLSIG